MGGGKGSEERKVNECVTVDTDSGTYQSHRQPNASSYCIFVVENYNDSLIPQRDFQPE